MTLWQQMVEAGARARGERFAGGFDNLHPTKRIMLEYEVEVALRAALTALAEAGVTVAMHQAWTKNAETDPTAASDLAAMLRALLAEAGAPAHDP